MVGIDLGWIGYIIVVIDYVFIGQCVEFFDGGNYFIGYVDVGIGVVCGFVGQVGQDGLQVVD